MRIWPFFISKEVMCYFQTDRLFFFFCSGHLRVGKKFYMNCAPWCTKFQQVVYNAPHGAQMPLFSYPVVHKCPYFLIPWCTNASQEVRTDLMFLVCVPWTLVFEVYCCRSPFHPGSIPLVACTYIWLNVQPCLLLVSGLDSIPIKYHMK